jgi:hypothetical protein
MKKAGTCLGLSWSTSATLSFGAVSTFSASQFHFKFIDLMAFPQRSAEMEREIMPTCLHCAKPVTGRQKYCADRCRQRARKGSRALRYRGGQNRQISPSYPIDAKKEFQPTFNVIDFPTRLRRPVIDLVGTDLLSEVVATEMERLKPVPASAYKHLDLEKVNPCTWKVVDPEAKTDVPASRGKWAGYRTSKALAWVMDVGYGRWMARCGNEVCNPTNLAEAKRQALAMAVGGIGDYQVSDPIKELHDLTAVMEDRYAKEFRVTPPLLVDSREEVA